MAVASALAMRYRACMVLSGVGDALGYKNGNWEFCRSGRAIHDELNSLGGVAKITVQCPGWTVSDDTVMHLATAEALMAKSAAPADKEALYSEILNHYKKSFNDMAGRAPGDTCAIVKIMHPDRPKGYQIDFNPRGGGCGASMRSMCIGLRYPRMAAALPLTTRYEACMVLSGVGDALGYKEGDWEFCYSGRLIHNELASLGGVAQITVQCPDWPVSDDTVMHLATAEALIAKSATPADKEALYGEILRHYGKSFDDMTGRAPGGTCSKVQFVNPSDPKAYQIDFNRSGGGCGAAMRSMCIGLRYPWPEDLADLIAVSVEAGRMSHHHPTGYLGSFAGALFTAYAIQGKPLKSWGHDLVNTLPQVLDYIRSEKRFVKENEDAWSYFSDKWKAYLEYRGLTDGQSDATFTQEDGSVEFRDKLYKSWSYSGWAGASGHDAPMIAYDALQASGEKWAELCSRSMFHSGDSDSTGVMAAAWFGALYGYADVPENNYKHVEYYGRLCKAAEKLYKLSQGAGKE